MYVKFFDLKKMLPFLVLLLFWTFPAFATIGLPETPVNTGLGSTYVYDLLPDSNSATRIYAATEEGAYITNNLRTSWTATGLEDYKFWKRHF